jgi:hypothetical protein
MLSGAVIEEQIPHSPIERRRCRAPMTIGIDEQSWNDDYLMWT